MLAEGCSEKLIEKGTRLYEGLFNEINYIATNKYSFKSNASKSLDGLILSVEKEKGASKLDQYTQTLDTQNEENEKS